MKLNALMKALDLDEIYGVDVETFWDRKQKYSLSHMATTEYVCDPRFELQLAAVQRHSWSKPRVMTGPEFVQWARTVNWSRAGFLAHHAHFDGLIASRYAGIKPKFYLDTLSMARPIMPVTVGRGLDALDRALGGQGKTQAQALDNVEGLRLAEFGRARLKHLKTYAGDDIESTWNIFRKLLPYVPLQELRLIHTTIEMYAQPLVLLDKNMLIELHESILARKQAWFDQLKLTRRDLMSNEKFASLLEDLGVQPPMKVSPRTSELTYAFAKNDLDFKDLLEHEDERVCALVEARLDVKSTSVETRASRLVMRSEFGAQPIYLNYWGAGPGRWSGGDRANWQNLKRGSDLRKSIIAPDGYEFIIADLGQIEARLNAWFALQQNIVDAFRRGNDVYMVAAAGIFGIPLDQVTKDQRFIGKVAVLGLGYGAGWATFARLLRLGQFGPRVNISDRDAQKATSAWRTSNNMIVGNWKSTNNKMKQAFFGEMAIDDGVVTYEGVRNKKTGVLNGFMHMPGGMAIRYDDVKQTEDGYDYLKVCRPRKTMEPVMLRGRLYGGLAVENRTQGLARCVIAEQMLAIQDELGPHWRQVMTTHDEVVGLVKKRSAPKALRIVQQIMTTPPAWAPDLPLAVDAHRSIRYDK